MSVEALMKDTEDHMRKSVEATQRELGSVRTGKATPALLDTIRVDYYGTMVPINQIASVASPEPRMLMVTPYDKNAMAAIEKAIQASEMGLNPSNDGNLIRVPIPQLTEERRKDLVKVVRGMIEHGRVAIRNVRHHSNDKLKALEKDGGLTEDEHKRHQKKIQELTDQYVHQLDDIMKAKETEVLEV